MKSQLHDFKNKLNNEIENKTDRYWLDQVHFDIGPDGNLNIYVGSEFVKNSIEKKVLKNIKKVYKTINPGFNCVFILDKSFIKTTISVDVTENIEKETIKEQPVFDLGFFDDLFIGSCNNLAITAAKNVVTNPGSRFNPLFVYGKPGVGKTHLLKTIEKSSFSSFYIDSESFLESYISGIKNKDIEIFKNKIRSVDILLIDDIQFFLGKKGVSEELFHTINYFLNN